MQQDLESPCKGQHCTDVPRQRIVTVLVQRQGIRVLLPVWPCLDGL